MRGALFQLAYWLLSVLYVLVSLPFLAWPGHGPVRAIIKSYTRAMNLALRLIAGIKKEVRGRQNLPDGAFVIASKHQSWGDGFATYDQFDDLAFVTGDHLEKFPLLGGVLKKLGAIVVNSCGGHEARQALATRAAEAKAENRKILIYPEGHLAPVGQKFRYRSGVWHMYRDFDMPVVPLATNLGLFWPEEKYEKHAGTATLEFLDPIPVGLPKDEFLARLEAVVETRTAELIAEATGQPVTPAVLMDTPK